MIYLDTESVGFTGLTVLIQWTLDDGPVQLHHIFFVPAGVTVQLIEKLMEHEVCGFNLTHDAFHLLRTWAVLRRLPGGEVPTPAACYAHWRQAAEEGLGMRPKSVLDLMLYARSGPMQALMEREDVRVRRVPAALAEPLCEELSARLDLPKIFFARKKDHETWKVQANPDDPDFPDVYLTFGAKGGLKALGQHLLGVDTLELPLPPILREFEEQTWDQFSSSASPALVMAHAQHWLHDTTAQRYAVQDVDLLRGLRRHWGNPPAGDDNSLLTFCVASCRFHGYAMDRLGVVAAHEVALKNSMLAPKAPEAVKAKLLSLCSETEKLVVTDTTGETLEAVAKWEGHPAAEFATKVIISRSAAIRAGTLYKLAQTRRFHPDFKVVGALSNRMAGAGKLNAQGIEKEFELDGLTHTIRTLFLMADEGEDLEGGDFDAFEVTIADAVYGDPKLHADLLSGKKLHALFGAAMYGKTYDEVKASGDVGGLRFPGMGWAGNLYAPAKGGVFAWLYGAQGPKLASSMRLEEEETELGVARFFEQYPVLAAGRQADADAFCSMRQPGGIGTNVVWAEPAEKVVSLLGWPRYFTLENKLTRCLFELAKKPSENLRGLKVKVRRSEHKGVQTASGAVQSALYGAAFQLQAANMRAAGNHRIQATGAGITKACQVAVWLQQPVGCGVLKVQPMQVHDELLSPTKRDLTDVVGPVVERYKSTVPLLKLGWRRALSSWGAIK
jgi:hypothetical protein